MQKPSHSVMQIITGIGAVLVSLGLLGGFFVYSGWPPYLERDDHDVFALEVERKRYDLEVELVVAQLQIYDYRQNTLQDKIWELEDRKRQMLRTPDGRREWFDRWERRLQQLYKQQAKNDKAVGRYEKRLPPAR